MADGAGAAAAAPSAAPSASEVNAQQTAEATGNKTNVATDESKSEEKTEKPSGRKRILERYAKSHPDRKFDDPSSDDELYGLIADDFEAYDKDKASYTNYKKTLDDSFGKFDEAPELFREMARGTHPFDYILDHYGEDFLDYVQSGEGKGKWDARRKKMSEDKARREEEDRQYDANMGESLKALSAWGAKHKLDEKAQADHYLDLRAILNDFADGKISEETFERFYNGRNYEKDVARAREQGEVNGRNATIQSEFQQSKARKNNPPTLSGQGGGSEEYDAERDGTLSMFGIPINKKK